MGVDEDSFLQHLESLNIDTSGVSFGWLLEEDNEILNWFFENIGINNCLSSEDRAYFTGLQESGNVLENPELQKELEDISKTYDGIVNPSLGNYDVALEDARIKLNNLNEWLDLFEKQELESAQCLERNENISKQLSKELFDLTETLSMESAIFSQLTDECQELVTAACEEQLKCFNLMQDVLKICTGSKNNDEALFFSQMPLDEMYTKTELLCTYMRLNVTNQMNFLNSNEEALPIEQNNRTNILMLPEKINSDWKSAENKLSEVCEKLREGIWCYIRSKAELAGVMEQYKFIENFDTTLCFDASFEKAKYAGLVKVLENDLTVLTEQKIPEDIHKFVGTQSEKLILGEMQIRYEKTKHMYDKLCSLAELSQLALLDTELSIMCVKRDQITTENLYGFSLDLLNTLQAFIHSSKTREMVPRPYSGSCFLLQTLISVLHCPISNSPFEKCSVDMIVSKIERLQADIKSLEMEVFQTRFNCIRQLLNECKHNSLPMRKIIWDGPTDQPSLCNASIDLALYDVRKANTNAEEDIKTVAKRFMEFKKIMENESVLGNLWKWFLADMNQIKLLRNKYARSLK